MRPFQKVYKTTLALSSAKPLTCADKKEQKQAGSLVSLFLTFNSHLVFDYLQYHQQELGISLYSKTLEQYINVEPGITTSLGFRESLGFLLVDQLSQTFERAKSAKEKPVFRRLDQCERGIVGLLNIDSRRLVVKFTSSWSTDNEAEVAYILGEKGWAPRVYEATDLAIAEEYILHPPLSAFSSKPSFVGLCLGKILYEIHQAGIIYDNTLIDHVRVKYAKRNPRPQIIDLETAYRGSDFAPDWQIATQEIQKLFPIPKDSAIAFKAMFHWQPLL